MTKVLQVPISTNQSRIANVVAWVRFGWRVVAFKPDRTRAYTKYANAPSLTVDQAKTTFEKYPDALIAIHLPSNVCVLDLDPREEDINTIHTRLRQKYNLPDGPEIMTPSGGRHLWFALPKNVVAKNWTSKNQVWNEPGVDLRGYRGLAIVPPSVRASGSYSWANQCTKLPLAPAELYQRFVVKQQGASPQPSSFNAPCQEIGPYAAAALKAELKGVANASKGSRNESLFISAVRLSRLNAKRQLPESSIKQALLLAAEANGLCRDDGIAACVATIQSGWKNGQRTFS